jgi:hypothetical protein
MHQLPLTHYPPALSQRRAEMPNSALLANKLLASYSNFLQLRLAALRSLSTHDQKPAPSCLSPRLRLRILLPHHLTPEDCFIQSP